MKHSLLSLSLMSSALLLGACSDDNGAAPASGQVNITPGNASQVSLEAAEVVLFTASPLQGLSEGVSTPRKTTQNITIANPAPFNPCSNDGGIGTLTDSEGVRTYTYNNCVVGDDTYTGMLTVTEGGSSEMPTFAWNYTGLQISRALPNNETETILLNGQVTETGVNPIQIAKADIAFNRADSIARTTQFAFNNFSLMLTETDGTVNTSLFQSGTIAVTRNRADVNIEITDLVVSSNVAPLNGGSVTFSTVTESTQDEDFMAFTSSNRTPNSGTLIILGGNGSRIEIEADSVSMAMVSINGAAAVQYAYGSSELEVDDLRLEVNLAGTAPFAD